jgi:hypothetical protein
MRKVFLSLVLAIPVFCNAGVYGEALTRCFASATSEKDKLDIFRWTFAVLSVHPGVNGVSRPIDSEREEFEKRVAKFVERLISEHCLSELRVALRFEGKVAFAQSIDAMFRTAVLSSLEDSVLKEEMGAFVRHLDRKKLGAALAP